MPQSLKAKIQFLYNLSTIALSDGVVHPTEKELLVKYVERVGFKSENSDMIADFMISNVREGKSVDDIIEQINA